jgi:membrane-associated protein
LVHHLSLAASFLNPEDLLRRGGLALLALIIFAESGLLVGFFLPGDSLLFIAGFLSSDAGNHVLPALPLVLLVAFVAAVAGDQVGYVFGRKVGPSLFARPDSRIFRQDHVRKAHAFFERHGAKTIVLARFVPIVRTFAPIVAGVSEMPYRTFLTFNIIGGLLWAVGVTTLGYFLGQVDVVKDHIEIALVLLVALSLLPVGIELLRHRRQARQAREARQAVPAVSED